MDPLSGCQVGKHSLKLKPVMSEDTTVEVALTTITGQSCTVRLPANATVRQGRAYIEAALQIPEQEQKLLKDTAILEEEAQPFWELAQQGVELLVLRQPRMNLRKFAAEHGYDDSDDLNDPSNLDNLLIEAGHKEEPNVCLEIICHPQFGQFKVPERRAFMERTNILRSLNKQLLFPAFESLLKHENFGKIAGLLDSGAFALHLAASAGLADHCRCLLESPYFSRPAFRKAPGKSTALHHAANAEILGILLRSPALATAKVLNAQDLG